MSDLYSPETAAAMRRDIQAWQAKKDAARDALASLCSDLLDQGIAPEPLGQILTGMTMYGFTHKDGRRFGWSDSTYHRRLIHKPDHDTPADQPTREPT